MPFPQDAFLGLAGTVAAAVLAAAVGTALAAIMQLRLLLVSPMLSLLLLPWLVILARSGE